MYVISRIVLLASDSAATAGLSSSLALADVKRNGGNNNKKHTKSISCERYEGFFFFIFTCERHTTRMTLLFVGDFSKSFPTYRYTNELTKKCMDQNTWTITKIMWCGRFFPRFRCRRCSLDRSVCDERKKLNDHRKPLEYYGMCFVVKTHTNTSYSKNKIVKYLLKLLVNNAIAVGVSR